MLDKITKVSILIIFGWMLGYMQHFIVTRDMLEGFNARMVAIERNQRGINDRISEVFRELMTLNEKFKIETDYKTTGYSNDPGSINIAHWRDGKTATGITARTGLCAADWNFLPVGTQIWVADYGWCEIQDRGGLIKGKHVDLFFDNVLDARSWGVKKTNIIVME